ncbi:unnamed protein product [Bemisia tabaci]|uniref:CRAL-TRIO domain-containing protein n=1 Tax=Bemisia tabaci TaxID=7038 RepID=A0A9P0AJP0_BEMTA|nr:unnamed protein product [Bemisia tabaci]
MSKEPHLPKIEDEEWIKTFLHHNKYRLEKTKKKIDNYYSYRSKYPEVLRNRDPQGKDIIQAREAFTICLSDKWTKEGERIVFMRPSQDTSIFDIKDNLKLLFMITDLYYLERDRHQHSLTIVDCSELSYTHFLKSLPWLKTGMEIFFTAYSDRLKAYHVINAGPGIDRVLNGFKSFLPKKIAERFFVHPSTKDLVRMVDENVVPCDLGGKGPRLAEYDDYTAKLLEKHRDWYLTQDDVASNEDMRRKAHKMDEVEQMTGSFRKIEVD